MKKVNPKKKYTKPADALHFVERMNLAMCRANSPSFEKLCRELNHYLIHPLSEDVIPSTEEKQADI
jgi:hypothetical protein